MPAYLLRLSLHFLIQKIGVLELLSQLQDLSLKADVNNDGQIDLLDLYSWVDKLVDRILLKKGTSVL